MSARPAIADVKALLIERLDALVGALAPGGRWRNGVYAAKCPWRADRSAGSFVVWARGKAAGAWKDYASGEAGDALDLVAFAACGAIGRPTRTDRIAALRWAEAWLGLSSLDPKAFEWARAKARRAQSEAEAGEAEGRRKRRNLAHRLWMDGRPIAGTAAETYLRTRGVDPALIGNFDDGFRFLPRLDHWTSRGYYGPALIAAMRHPKHGFAALHAVWLTPCGTMKTSVTPAKLTLGAMTGSAMRIIKGAGEHPPLALCEGPEDGASVALACPDYSVWAVGGLSNLAHQTIPPGTPHVTVCADNDWSGSAAAAQLERAVAALAAQNIPVTVARAHHGKDMNDLARFG